MQERIMRDSRPYTLMGGSRMGGSRIGKTYMTTQVLKAFPHKTCLVPNLRSLDNYIALGVQPSQLVLPGELALHRERSGHERN